MILDKMARSTSRSSNPSSTTSSGKLGHTYLICLDLQVFSSEMESVVSIYLMGVFEE